MGPETKGAPPLRISGQKMYGQEPSGMMLETVPRIALGRYLAYSAPSEYAASMGEGGARSGGPLREGDISLMCRLTTLRPPSLAHRRWLGELGLA